MHFSALTAFDYVVVTLIGLSTLMALLRGFIQSVLSFSGWILAAIAAYYLLPFIRPTLLAKWDYPLLVDMVGGFAIYMVALVVMAIINYRILRLTEVIRGGAVDMSLGVAFGILRGVALACIIFLTITLASPLLKGKDESKTAITAASKTAAKDNVPPTLAPEWLAHAQTYPFLKSGSDLMLRALPNSLKDMLMQSQKEPKKPISLPSHPAMALDPQNLDTLHQIISSMPKNMLPGSKQLSPDDAAQDIGTSSHGDLLRAIVAAYKEAVRAGVVSDNAALPQDQINDLDKALHSPLMQEILSPIQTPIPDDGTMGDAPSYDRKQVNEINRLMETLDK